jgi:hypothetical protein
MPIPIKFQGTKMGASPGKVWSECPPNVAAHRERSKDAAEGVKGFTPKGEPLGKNVYARMHGSKSKARKRSSAEIAKIPPALAAWIAKTFKINL